MSSDRDFELGDLVHHPGVYYSPATEVLVIVDDSTEIDNEIITSAGFEESEWILVSDEVPVDEHQRDIVIEEFQSTFSEARSSALDDGDDVDETDAPPEFDEDEDEDEGDDDTVAPIDEEDEEL